jgi:hypothetical protein
MNVPMFQKDKEFHAAGYVGLNHSELQTAYSVDSINGFILNGYVGYRGQKRDTTFSKGLFFEGGYSYSKYLKNKYKVEVIGGYGYGEKKYFEHYACDCFFSFYPNHREVWYDFDNRFHRLFAQINFGAPLSKKPESNAVFAFSLRAISMFYTKYSFFYEKYDLNKSYIYPIEKDYAELKNKTVFLFEPGFTLRFGFNPVYFTYQLSFPALALGQPTIRKYASQLFYTSLGISFKINHK